MTSEKIHTIDGVKYREVERKAEVGDYVYYKDDERVAFVVPDSVASGIGVVDGGETYLSTVMQFAGVVLERVNESESSQPSDSLLDLIAKLTTRLMRLEDELDDVRKNVQTFAEATSQNEADIRALDERTQPLVALKEALANDRTNHRQ